MTVEDRLLMLDVFCGVCVAPAPDGEHLIVRGPSDAIECALPMLALHKAEILAHLHDVTDSSRTA